MPATCQGLMEIMMAQRVRSEDVGGEMIGQHKSSWDVIGLCVSVVLG